MSIYNISTTLTTNNPKPSWQDNSSTLNVNAHPALQKINLPGTNVLTLFSNNRFLYGNSLKSSNLNSKYNDSLLIKYDNYLNVYQNINKAKILQPFKN